MSGLKISHAIKARLALKMVDRNKKMKKMLMREDSAVFMLLLGFFSWYGLSIMFASKMVGAVIVWYFMADDNEVYI